jgi:RNA polymerase sigma factor (sigma-70 family)
MKSLMSKPVTVPETAIADALLANLTALRAFARRRLGDEHLAADAVQESVLRALKSKNTLSHDENLLAWLYRILRNVLTDLHRRKSARMQAMEHFAEEVAAGGGADAEIEQMACACFRGLLPVMRPDYAQVLQLSDLDGLPAETVARQLGITRSNLKVRLHRARRQLRERLEQTCQLCAAHGCLDCHCNPND